MQRSSTDKNLSVISNRNNGRRKSLDFSNEFTKESSSEDDLTNEKAKRDLARSNDELNNELKVDDVKRMINDIDYKHTLRFRKTKTKTKDTPPEEDEDHESYEKSYRSQFGDIKFFEARTTIFDDDRFRQSQFFGIYVLFWLSTAFLMVNNIIHAYMDNEGVFFQAPIVKILRKDLFKIGLSDLTMYVSTYTSFIIQLLCKKSIIHWRATGWILQAVYDFVFVAFWLIFASEFWMNYHWIGRVFLLLHSLVLLMKMHSYGFYNGYLWKIKEELDFSRKYFNRFTEAEPQLPGNSDLEKTRQILKNSIDFCEFELNYQASYNSLYNDPSSNPPLAPKVTSEFPKNLTLKNYFEFTMFPTVTYTLNFPRTERIRWSYVFEKCCAIFGIFFLMIIVAQNGIYPLVLKAQEAKYLPIREKALQYFLILMDMIPSFLLEYLFTFFIIWEFILNTVAELSMFADRDFYGPWWSCSDWGEFSRIWNRPVHKFLLRHVYHSSISAIRLNKLQASLFTFVLSALIHELVMYSIFKSLRGYLLLFQMSQLPLMMFSNTKLMKDKKVLGNVLCWFGFISGPSIICTLYLFF